MAQVNYEAFMKYNEREKTSFSGTSSSGKPYVRYFSLKDDGDTATVRFNISSMDSRALQVQSIHRVKNSEGKYRVVSCLRGDPAEPFEVCPLCASGERPAFRIFIELLDYQQDENGNTVAVPSTWEQPARARETFKSFVMDYGDLRDYVFKIVRHGRKGDPSTTYTILPANQNIYKEDVFKKDFSAFDSYSLSDRMLELSGPQMENYIETGELPTDGNKSTKEMTPVEQPKSVETSTYTAPTSLRASPLARGEDSSADIKPAAPRRYTY